MAAKRQSKIVVFIATGWGANYGGINSFNTDLCKSLASVVSPEYAVVCAIPDANESEIEDARKSRVHLLNVGYSLSAPLADHIYRLIKERWDSEVIWWVGHDIYSGEVANFGRKNLCGRSAVFHHMAYWEYSTLKSMDGNRTDDLDKRQETIARECDIFFGVGPRLFTQARTLKRNADDKNVQMIIPGLHSIEKANRPEKPFSAIIFGRMEKADDVIKKSRLGVKAFGVFTRELMETESQPPLLTIIGFPRDKERYNKEILEIYKIFETAAERRIAINALSYREDRDRLFELLSRHHVCLMLSLHEGFGLAGWEAIAAEVPLIVSKNSGLFRLLDESHHELTSFVYPVDIRGAEDDKEDIQEIVTHLKKIEKDFKKASAYSKELKRKLIEAGYTWENAARTFAQACNIPCQDIILTRTIQGKMEEGKAVEKKLPIISALYASWLRDNYACMEADKLYGKQAFPLSLPEIFIPLFANRPGIESQETMVLDKKKEPADIEELVAENDCLLVEGQAGSGKTTVLKHMTYCLADEQKKRDLPAGLQNYLPFLISLKTLNEFFREMAARDRQDFTVEDVLSWCMKFKMGDTLNLDTLGEFKEAKKVLFMLDGLDEILPEHKDRIVHLFADLRLRNPGNKLVLTGRPHTMAGATLNRFEKSHVKINPLTQAQVKKFIEKWFSYFYPGKCGPGGRTAEAMIHEMQSHPAIGKLTDNPLMLTAICILYHDQKELPGQRAELYKRFMDNLLYRRFSDYEKIHGFLKALAFHMHKLHTQTIDRNEAIKILQGVFRKDKNEDPEDYKKRVGDLFDDIESRCGVLKFENGQYLFWHLTFQEFLCADYIADNCDDHVRAVADYWDDDWYKEVMELYISYVSIQNKKTANNIVQSAIESDDRSPFKKWRVAAAGLYDIHIDRRDENLVRKVSQRLLEVLSHETRPKILADAGELLGWLADPRDLKRFVKIEGRIYDLEGLGKKNIRSFEIAVFPVTNSWFEEFVKDGGYKEPNIWSEEGEKWLTYNRAECPKFWNERQWKCPNAPLVGISWYEADAFCRWLTNKKSDGFTYRLPTEQEWQTAAAGYTRREYPWGDKWNSDYCNCFEGERIGKTSPVGIFRNGATPEGIHDLAGNVWEWTNSDFHSKKVLNDFMFDEEMQRLLDERKFDEFFAKLDEEKRQLPVLRGGSWFLIRNYCRCAYRDYDHPVGRYDLVGFRCARS